MDLQGNSVPEMNPEDEGCLASKLRCNFAIGF